MKRDTNKKSSSLSKSLKDIAQSLIGKLSPREVNSVMLSFSLIRRMELILEPHKVAMRQIYVNYVNVVDEERMHMMLCELTRSKYYNKSGLSLSEIVTSAGDFFNQLFYYVNGFSSSITDVLKAIDFERLMAKLNHANLIFSVMNSFVGLDLSDKKIKNYELTDALEQFTQGKNYETPILFSLLVDELLFGMKESTAPMNFYDPACGTGKLLRDILKAYRDKGPAGFRKLKLFRGTHIYGQDISSDASAIARIMSILAGDDPEHIASGDSLEEDHFPDNKFKYIVCDTPAYSPTLSMYGGWSNTRTLHSIFKSGRFGLGSPKDSSLIYIQHIISKMDPTGSQAAVFTGLSALRSGGNLSSADSSFRKEILSRDLVEAIIALPFSGITSTQKVPRFLWILNNHKSNKQQGKVRLIDCNKIMAAYADINYTDEKLVRIVAEKCYDKDVEKCSIAVDNLSFGKYQITLVNQLNKERRVIDVPMQEDVYHYLKLKGFKMGGSHNPSEVRDDDVFDSKSIWEIDYPKTTSSCVIDFAQFFSTIEETATSAETFSRIQPVLDEITELATSLNQFKRVVRPKNLAPCETEWYKEVPTNWKLTSGSHCLTVMAGHTVKEWSTAEGGIPLLTAPYLRGKDLPSKYVDAHFVRDERRIIQEGEILVILVGENAGESLRGKYGVISPSLTVIRTKDETVLDSRYLGYLIIAAEGYLKSTTYGTPIKHLMLSTIRDIPLYLPPIIIQKQIADYLDSICSKIARLHELGFNNPQLKEFQKSLIYEAVTGKLDLDDMK